MGYEPRWSHIIDACSWHCTMHRIVNASTLNITVNYNERHTHLRFHQRDRRRWAFSFAPQQQQQSNKQRKSWRVRDVLCLFLLFLVICIIMSSIPERLTSQYADLAFMKEKMATMKQNQQMRGLENYNKRMTERATTHNTWRQMKGFQLAMHEIKHPGNRAFVIGLGWVHERRGCEQSRRKTLR